MTITGILCQLFQHFLSFNTEYGNITDNAQVLYEPPGGVGTSQDSDASCQRHKNFRGTHRAQAGLWGWGVVPHHGPLALRDHMASGESNPRFSARDSDLQDMTASTPERQSPMEASP